VRWRHCGCSIVPRIRARGARRAHRQRRAPLLLWHPDETTLAWAQLYLPRAQWRALRSNQPDTATQLGNALLADAALEVLVQVRHGHGKCMTGWPTCTMARCRRRHPTPSNRAGTAGRALSGIAVIERPGGRRYLLLRRSLT